MSKPLIILLLLVSCIQLLHGQVTGFEIASISFDGLKKTKTAYLRSIISTTEDQVFREDVLKLDIQNLKNLSGIINANYRLDTIDHKININYFVEERRTAIPIVNLGGIEGNVWFALGGIDNNLTGNGDVALAFYQNNDGRHSAQLYYERSRLNNSKWGYSGNINKWSSIEPLYFSEGSVDYLYDNNGIGIRAIRNFGLRRQLEFGSTFFRERYRKAEEQFLENPPGPEDVSLDKFLSKIILKQNFINYHYFYQKGHELSVIYQNVYNIDDASWFNSVILQSKLFFRPKPKWNIASRIIFGVSTNNNSPFAPFVADSHVNIRGIGNRIERGTAQAVINAELRYTCHHKKNWASQLVVFSDFGGWRNPGGTLSDLLDSDEFRHFVGLGTRLIYQKVFGASLRIDYGVDLYDIEQRGIVIGLGQYF